MKKIALILTLVLLSACAKSVETVKPEVGQVDTDEQLYRIDSALTFSVPKSGYTMIAGGTEGKELVMITYGNSDLKITLTIVADLSQMGYEGFSGLQPLSVSQLLTAYSTGAVSKSCEARFADKGAECEMAGEYITEVVPLEDQGDPSIDEYLVVKYPYGKGDGVAGLSHIFESINLDPTDLELASATSIRF